VLNEERRRSITELVNREGRVLVADLSKQFEPRKSRFVRTWKCCTSKDCCIAAMAAPSRPGKARSKTRPCARKSSFTVRRSSTLRRQRRASSKRGKSSFLTLAPPRPRFEHSEFAGIESEPGDARSFATEDCRVRLQQVRAAQPLPDQSHFVAARRHHRSRDSKARPERT